MENSTNKSETSKVIVAFHIGRGGRYNNSGFKSFVGEKNINEFVYDLFINYENIHEVSEKIKDNSILNRNSDFILDLINDGKFEELQKFGITEEDLGKLIYTTCGGNDVGLYVENDGIGCINIDHTYNTTYACPLEDLDEAEIELIVNSNEYKSYDLIQFLEEVTKKKFDRFGALISEIEN